MKVNVVSKVEKETLLNYDVICVTEIFTSISELIEWNQFIRDSEKHIGFILTQNLGVSGYAFVDFGDNFVMFDKDGEQTKPFIVSRISNENPGVVTVHEDKVT